MHVDFLRITGNMEGRKGKKHGMTNNINPRGTFGILSGSMIA